MKDIIELIYTKLDKTEIPIFKLELEIIDREIVTTKKVYEDNLLEVSEEAINYESIKNEIDKLLDQYMKTSYDVLMNPEYQKDLRVIRNNTISYVIEAAIFYDNLKSSKIQGCELDIPLPPIEDISHIYKDVSDKVFEEMKYKSNRKMVIM